MVKAALSGGLYFFLSLVKSLFREIFVVVAVLVHPVVDAFFGLRLYVAVLADFRHAAVEYQCHFLFPLKLFNLFTLAQFFRTCT